MKTDDNIVEQDDGVDEYIKAMDFFSGMPDSASMDDRMAAVVASLVVSGTPNWQIAEFLEISEQELLDTYGKAIEEHKIDRLETYARMKMQIVGRAYTSDKVLLAVDETMLGSRTPDKWPRNRQHNSQSFVQFVVENNDATEAAARRYVYETTNATDPE
jgi:hypothetical protein